MILAHDSERRFIVSTTAPRPASCAHPRSSLDRMFASRHRHSASDCAGRRACSARYLPEVQKGLSDPAQPGQLHPDKRGTEEVPGYAAQRPSQLSHVCATRLGHRAVYGPVDRFNAQLVSRWNNPACHPHNAVHSRGKGICTMPHLFCGTCDTSRQGRFIVGRTEICRSTLKKVGENVGFS